jgi:poly-beta-1,6-N-acetyl-D-glucosamine synthase
MNYVLVTPARDEEAFIERTIASVMRQSLLPLKWVIVSDGSTDATAAIVQRHAIGHDWMELVEIPPRQERNFAGKVAAFNAGYERVKHLDYQVIGNLDADISFGPDYIEYLLQQFTRDLALGVAGTPFEERGVRYDYRFSRTEHVSGACQLFRRECFEDIGGYVPIRGGAVDLAAVVTARMKGWHTQTFLERVCLHHRPMGTASSGMLLASFRSGYGDYRMGVHPAWQFCRSVYQMSRRPVVLGGTMLLAGYLYALARRAARPIPGEFVVFRRREQMQWLKEYFRRWLSLGRL